MAKGLQTFPLVKCIHPESKNTYLISEHEYLNDPEKHILADGEEVTGAPASSGEKKDGAVDFSKMNVNDMKSFAKEYGIDLNGANSKTEILKVLEAWKEANKVA